MAKTNQDFTMYAGERKTMRIPVVDQDASPEVPLDNLDSVFAVVKWGLVQVDPSSGGFSTSPLEIEKKSGVSQPATGGNEIDITSVDGTNDSADVQLVGADTDALTPGDYYHELEGFDGNGEGVVLATGTITILANLDNT